MATTFNFGGRSVKQPGAYATIVSGGQAQPTLNNFGKVLIIDTGLGANWSGGSGVAGELAAGKQSVYLFDELTNFQSILNGGLLWKAAEALFKPDDRIGAQGASQVMFAKAAATTCATITFSATGGGDNGGVFAFKTKHEGTGANGVLTSTHLDKGYAYTVETAPVDTSKWVIKVWKGSWKGDHSDGIAYDEIAKADSVADLMIVSPEFSNIQTLITWAQTDPRFSDGFELDSADSEVTGTGLVDAADIAAITGYVVATGGTETYSSANLDLVLSAIEDEYFNFILLDKYGTTDFDNVMTLKIKNHIVNTAKFKSFCFYGGGKDADEFTATDGSVDIAKYFNSAYMLVVHGDVKLKSSSLGAGFRRWPSIITAAKSLGRAAGKSPQIPLTGKSIGIDGLFHEPSRKDRDIALDYGVIMPYRNNSTGLFTILEGINSLQDNRRVMTPQGYSFLLSSMRIIEQINGELITNTEASLLTDENGVNRKTLSKNVLVDFVSTYLENRTATATSDNLLISWRNVTATRVNDAWVVNYEIEINSEINKIFYTGVTI